MMDKSKYSSSYEDEKLKLMQSLVRKRLGALDPQFLSAGISILNPPDPVCITDDSSVDDAVALLKEFKVTCVLVTDQTGRLSGIYSERDYLLKDYGKIESPRKIPVTESMTMSPITATPSTSVASVMSLMANGGFRHVPVVDEDGFPIWMISMKLIVDALVESYTAAILDF